MKYTIEDVLYYLEENIDLKGYNGRHRYILDKRNYFIHLLCFKFGKSEYEVASILKIKRSAVHHSKYHAYHWKEDLDFKLNTERIRKLFPYPTQKPIKHINNTLHRIAIKLDKDELKKITKFKNDHGEANLESAIRKMIRIY